MSSLIYDSYLRDNSQGAIDTDTDTFYLLLVTSSYSPSKSGHTKRSDVTNEVVGTGYVAGGSAVVLTGSLSGSDRWDITLGSVSWSSSTITAAGGVVYKHRGGAASADELVCYLDFGGNVSSTAGTFAVNPTSPLRIQN